MGCDIHAIFQAKRKGANGKYYWRNVPTLYDEPRHYFLFAWLAGVRNGYGFAGVPTHDPVTPISEPRGMPDDFDQEDATCWACLHDKWLGDHSHSWLTVDEILSAPLPDGVMRTGVIDRATFEKWDGRSAPENYCGGISGRDIKVASSPRVIEPDSTHVQVEWLASPSLELDYFRDEVKRLRDKHGEVRMIFGFDS